MKLLAKKIMLITFLLQISLGLFNQHKAASQSLEAEALYKRGIVLFSNGKYISARLDFTEIITQHPKSNRVTPSLVMLSKSYFEQGDYDLAENTALTLRRSHPDSRYNNWVDYMLAACSFKSGNTENAVSSLSRVITSTDKVLRAKAYLALKNTIRPATDANVFQSLLRDNNIELESVTSAINVNTDSADNQSSFDKNWKSGQTIKIGLLAPLSGFSSFEGQELLRGVKAALTNYQSVDGRPVELLVEDTASNPVQAVLKTRKLVENDVIAIIGPVYGESTISSALESDKSGIPFLAPTASDVGLTKLGINVFQLNHTPVTQAEALAQVASQSLGFSNAAIIAGDDWWGRSVADTFSRNFENAGGSVLTVESFEPNVSRFDYNDIIMNIRASAPESEAYPDSFVVFNYGTAFPDTVIVIPDPESISQFMQTINSIDCVLVSALNNDAVNIVRLIRDYHIDTVLLGDSGWSDENTVIDMSPYGEGSYLISTVTDETENPGSQFFKDNFLIRKSELREITAKKGYDACALIIHCLGEGATSPSSLAKRLESIDNFVGLSSRYSIDPDRHINTAVDFVQIREGKLVRVNPTGVKNVEDDDSTGF